MEATDIAVLKAEAKELVTKIPPILRSCSHTYAVKYKAEVAKYSKQLKGNLTEQEVRGIINAMRVHWRA